MDVTLGGGQALRAKYLVSCDGGRSRIRKQAGIDFPGWEPSVSYLIAEVEMTSEPEWGIRRGDKGIHGIGKLEDGKRARVLLIEPGALEIAPWADRVERVDARYAGMWELPVLGLVAAPTAVLIRPDGHVAWVGDGTDLGLRDALTRWFGPPS